MLNTICTALNSLQTAAYQISQSRGGFLLQCRAAAAPRLVIFIGQDKVRLSCRLRQEVREDSFSLLCTAARRAGLPEDFQFQVTPDGELFCLQEMSSEKAGVEPARSIHRFWRLARYCRALLTAADSKSNTP